MKMRGGGPIKMGGGTISEGYKSGWALMGKIKDFTLAFKNLGGDVPPCPTVLPPMTTVLVGIGVRKYRKLEERNRFAKTFKKPPMFKNKDFTMAFKSFEGDTSQLF